VYYIQYEVWGGWLVRGIHYYAAQMLLILCGLYVLHLIFSAAYRAPRELVYWLAIGLTLLTVALLLTGELLVWTQSGYWSTFVRTNFLFLLPGVGPYLHKLAIGGPSMGNFTATRFLALHAGLLPVLFGGAWCLLRYVARRAAAASPAGASAKGPVWWPNRAMVHALAWFAVTAIVVLLSCRGALDEHPAGAVSGDCMGVELGSPRDPGEQYAAARPDWYFVGLFQFAYLFPGQYKIVPIFIIPGLLVALFLAMPFVARSKPGQAANMAMVAGLLAGVVYLSIESKRADAANELHQSSLAAATIEADRVKELIRDRGIPPAGALSLLLDDPVTQGPKLLRQHCSSCHDVADAEGNGILSDKPTAPNLHGFATYPWLVDLHDPKKIAYAPKPGELSPTNRPRYYGSTKFAKGKMAEFVKDTLPDLRADNGPAFAEMIQVLAAEAKRPEGRKASKAEVQKLDDFGCLDCHKFHDKGKLTSVDLTGYGSRKWLIGIISDPSQKMFYGDKNDRMPAYFNSPDKPADNLLNARQVELMAEWIQIQNP
jgi:ubiquinol-cytochrome c reductase cytochrome b subunit